MQKANRHVCAVLGRIIVIGLSLQILLGILWMCCNFGRIQEFEESLFYIEVPIPYIYFLQVLQLVAAFLAGGKFLKAVGVRKRLYQVFGSLAILTIPAAMQCHLAVLPYSLNLSVFLLEVAFVTEAVRSERPLQGKQLVKANVCWLISALLLPEYLYLGAVPVLLLWVYDAWKYRKKKGSAVLWHLLLIAVFAGMIGVTGKLLPEPDTNGRAANTVEGALFRRLCWGSLEQGWDDWPEDMKESCPYGLTVEATFYPENMERLLQCKLEEEVGLGRAREIYRELSIQALRSNPGGILRQTLWDVAGYTAPSAVLRLFLAGRGYDSLAGRNYDSMKRETPFLTKYYVNYSGWWMAVGILLTAAETLLSRMVQPQQKGRKKMAAAILCIIPAGMMVLWYTMQGAGVWDYKKGLYAGVLWIVWMVLRSIPALQQTDNGKIKARLPELFVILFCMLLLAVGVSKKEGFHMDELLSYELSNGEFNPWIVPTQPQGRLAKFVHNEIKGENWGETLQNLADTAVDVLQNRGSSKLLSYQADVYQEPVWITAEQFCDYITVDGDGFNYLSVYFNVKDDNHPPIHFMLLHTISSMFPGQASVWMGCLINMVCVAVCMVLLMRLGRLLAPFFGCEKWGRELGILAALLYGCSTGAMATTLLIRMYGVLTCLCVALFYIHMRKWTEKKFDAGNKGLIAVTVLGFLTQYFFLFYCLVLAAVTAVLLWRGRRRRDLCQYSRSMMLAGVIGVGLFPFAIADVFSSGRGVEALGNLTAGLAGFGTRLGSFFAILTDRTFGIFLWGVLAALALLSAVVYATVRKWSGQGSERKRTAVLGHVSGSRRAVMALFVVPLLGYFLLAARMSPYLVDRYIMPLFPFVTLLGTLVMVGSVGWAEQVVKQSKTGRIVGIRRAGTTEKTGRRMVCLLGGLALALQLWHLAGYDGAYLYSGYARQEQLSQEYTGYPCICVYDGVGYYENLPEFAHYDRTLLVTEPQLQNRVETASVSSLNKVVVLLKASVEKEQVFETLKDKYGLALEKVLLQDSVRGDSIYLFGSGQGKSRK